MNLIEFEIYSRTHSNQINRILHFISGVFRIKLIIILISVLKFQNIQKKQFIFIYIMSVIPDSIGHLFFQKDESIDNNIMLFSLRLLFPVILKYKSYVQTKKKIVEILPNSLYDLFVLSNKRTIYKIMLFIEDLIRAFKM